MSARRASWLPLVGLVGVATSLGSGHVCARLAFTHGVTVITAATMRSVCAGLLLLAVLAWRRTSPWPPMRSARFTPILGLFVVVQTLLIQYAVTLLPVTLAILVFYTYPFLTSVATSLLGEHRLSTHLVAALVCAFAGLVLVLGVGTAPVSVLGILVAFGASVAFTAALVLTPRLAPNLGAPLRTFYTMATSAFVLVVAAIATGRFHLPADMAAWTGLAGLSLLYAAGISGLFLLLPLLGPVQTAVVLNLEPVIVAMVAWIALGEALTPWQCVGAVVVVGAVIAYQAKSRKT
ncbi:MAG: DMT family transporter [Betaproteobacteria bacterium]